MSPAGARSALVAVVAQCYLEGVSARRVEDVARALGIERLSKSQVCCLPPKSTPHGQTERMSEAHLGRFTCPCCGHLVFEDEPGSDAICPVCFWQDDLVQLRWPNFGGGANRPSLIEAQKNVANFGAVEERLVQHVRPARSSECLDAAWRPFDPDRDAIVEHRPGVDYGRTYSDDRTAYYYWREGTR